MLQELNQEVLMVGPRSTPAVDQVQILFNEVGRRWRVSLHPRTVGEIGSFENMLPVHGSQPCCQYPAIY